MSATNSIILFVLNLVVKTATNWFIVGVIFGHTADTCGAWYGLCVCVCILWFNVQIMCK